MTCYRRVYIIQSSPSITNLNLTVVRREMIFSVNKIQRFQNSRTAGFSYRILHVFIVIHTLQLNFLLSDWLFIKYAEYIENVHCTPRTAPRLCPDCARCFWCVISCANVTSADPFCHLLKLLIFFMFSGILKPFYLQFFTNMSKLFCFYVVYELGY